MSSHTVTYAVDDGTPVVFEIEPVEGFVPATPDEFVGRVRTAMGPIVEAAKEVLAQARAAAPDDIEVKFGVKVTGTMTWVVAKASTEGNFEVTLKWRRKAEPG
jgi:hypothetical protein